MSRAPASNAGQTPSTPYGVLVRITRLVLAAAALGAALATPASAALPVTVEFQGPVNCVTYPCPQPTPVVVCVTGVACTPR